MHNQVHLLELVLDFINQLREQTLVVYLQLQSGPKNHVASLVILLCRAH